MTEILIYILQKEITFYLKMKFENSKEKKRNGQKELIQLDSYQAGEKKIKQTKKKEKLKTHKKNIVIFSLSNISNTDNNFNKYKW